MTKMYIILMCVLAVMVLFMVYLGYSNEAFVTAKGSQLLEVSNKTVIGGTTSEKVVFSQRGSTNVTKLTGDSDQVVVFIHNTPFDQEVWSPIYMVTQHYKDTGKSIPTLYRYDTLGHGTAWAQVPKKYNDNNMNNYIWSFDEFISDLFEIYGQYIKNKKIILVGYGFGGNIAQAFALRYPDLIEHLYILATTIGPTVTGIPDEVSYLVRWINDNQLVPYLTMEESFVQWNLCLWFENNDKRICPYFENNMDTRSVYNSVEYLLAQKLYRTGSSTTYLQMDKLIGSEDLRPVWKNKTVPFPVTFLIANRDHYTNINTMRQDVEIVKKASPNVKMYIVNGKHGFPLAYPEYIYDLILGQDMSKNALTLETI